MAKRICNINKSKTKKSKSNHISKDSIMNKAIDEFISITGFNIGEKFRSKIKEKIEKRISK